MLKLLINFIISVIQTLKDPDLLSSRPHHGDDERSSAMLSHDYMAGFENDDKCCPGCGDKECPFFYETSCPGVGYPLGGEHGWSAIDERRKRGGT